MNLLVIIFSLLLFKTCYASSNSNLRASNNQGRYYNAAKLESSNVRSHVPPEEGVGMVRGSLIHCVYSKVGV